MYTALWIFTVLATFCFMEFVAWFSHKYIMHGFLWFLHKDHHKKDHDSWFERNDMFFLQYAAISIFFTVLWGEYGFWLGLPIAIGIFMYGLAYFIVQIFLFIKDLKFLEILTINTPEALEELIKFTTNI